MYLEKYVHMAAIPFSLPDSNLHQGLLRTGNMMYVSEREIVHYFAESWISVHLSIIETTSAMPNAARNVFSFASELQRH